MSVLGAVSIEVALDFNRLDRELDSLNSKKIKPLRMGLGLDTKEFQEQIKQLPKLDCIKVDLCPDVDDFKEKLKRVGRLVDCIKVELCPDVNDLRQKIDQIKIDPIKVDLSPNITDFQEKLKRVGRVSPIQIDIFVDKAAVKSRFEEVGRYAAEGFSEGFSAAGDIGKAAAKSLVTSVKKELRIQSPSKVFEDIGEDSSDGLFKGLKRKTGQVQGIVKDLESQFRNAKLEVDLKVNAKGVRAKITAQNQTIAPAKNADTFTFKSFESDLTGAIEKGFRAASKKSLLELLLGGIGSVGSAMAGLVLLPVKAAVFTLGTIATGTLLKVGEDLSSGVSAGLKSSIGAALSSTVGNSTIVGEAIGEAIAESAGSVLKSTMPDLAEMLSEIVREVVGSEKVAIADLSRKSQSETQLQSGRAIAGQQLQKEYKSASERGLPARARQLQSEIDAVLPQLKQDQRNFSEEYANEKQRLENAAEQISIKLSPKKLIEIKVKEYEAQIKSYAEFQKQLESQGQTGKAAAVKSLSAQLKPPDQDESKISDKELRFAEARYTATSRQNLVSKGLQKFGSRKAELNKRQNEIAPKIQELEAITREVTGIVESMDMLGVSPDTGTKKTKAAAPIQPKLYENIFQETIQESGLQNVAPELIPQLMVSGSLAPGKYGTYNPETNQIDISKEAYELIQQGEISKQEISTLVHEMRHALQFDFGRNSSGAAVQLLSPTARETRQLGQRIELSTQAQPAELQSTARRLESDAYVFEARNAPVITKRVEKKLATEKLESSFGIGGAKAELSLKLAQNEAVKKIIGINKVAQGYGIDLQAEMQSAISDFEAIKSSITPLLDKASSIESLESSEIETIYQDLSAALTDAFQQVEAIPSKLKQSLVQKKAQPQQIVPTQSEIASTESLEIEANLNRLPAAHLRVVAKQLGVSTYNKTAKKRLSKPELVQSLLASNHTDLTQALPSVGKPSPEILQQSKQLTALPIEELKMEIKFAYLAIKQGLKQAKGNKDSQHLGEIIDDIHHQEELISQALAQNVQGDVKAQLEGFRLRIAKAKYEAKDEQGKIKLSQQQSSIRQSSGIPNQFNSLPNMNAVDDLVNSLKAMIGKGINEVRGENTSAYGAHYAGRIKSPLTSLEAEAKEREKAAARATQQAARATQASQKLVQQLETERRVKAEIDEKLKELEQQNSGDPSVAATVATDDAMKGKRRRDRTVKEIRQNPRQFIANRAKSATIQKARYIAENAEGITALVGAKIGTPGIRQTQSLLNLQDAFGKLGEASVKFGQSQSSKDFKVLNTAVKELETSLRALGVPFELINREIDAYMGKLKKMQAEGKIDVDVDVDALAPEKFSFIDNILAKFSDLEVGGLKSIGGLAKGFVAFTAASVAQNFLQNLAQDAFKAYVELDKLKTALNFASGGSAAGGQNLAFVRQMVDEFKIPLRSTTEGFTKLASTSRGTPLEGKGTQDLSLGLAQASTVLSLTDDETNRTFKAITDMLGKGKVSAEEMRGQLSESGLAGAMGIAARATGVTEQEFARLLDTGQIISQDFLPKFAKQLQAEFGDAAKDASGNAQSAIFDLENSFLSLQQGIGEGVAPAAIVGLSIFTGLIKGVSAVGRELGFILLGITAALAVKMVGALQAVIAQMIATKVATGTLGGGLASLGQTINNSFSTKLTVGLFAVLEIINLLNKSVNTDLVQSFDKAAKSAQGSAEASRKAFESKPGQQKQDTLPEASNGFARFTDKYLIGGINAITIFDQNKLKTYGQLEKDNIQGDIGNSIGSTNDLLASARFRLNQLKTRTGETGKLPEIDAELQSAEQKRQILQAQIKRDFTDKGLATPAALNRELEVQNLALRGINDKRAEISKPFSLDLSRTDQQMNAIKAQIESLKSPEAIALFGEEGANKQQQQLNQTLEALKQFKAEAESALASLKVDPVRAFAQSLREMNLALAENQEKNELKFTDRRSAIATNQLAGFSTDKFASKRAARETSEYEYERSQANLSTLEEAIQKGNKTINASNFQSTLRRLGVSPDATSAKIDDVLKNTTDEADKGILENLKSVREQRNKLPEARLAVTESRQKLKQQNQEDFLFNIDESTANSRATTSKEDNRSVTSIKNAQIAKVLVEEVANEKIAAIQLKTTRKQQKSLDEQLTKLRSYYGQGEISAEEFAKRERDLTVEQSNLEKQEAENRAAVQAATKERRLKSLEIANKKAENAITFAQIDANTNTKLGILSGDIGQEASQQQQNQAEQQATLGKIKLIKKQIADTKELRQAGVLDARDATEKETALNIELAQSNQQLIDQQIQAQENLRQSIEKTFQRREQQLDLENSQQDTQTQSDSLRKLESSPELDLRGLELETSGKGLENRSSLLASQIALVQEQLAGVDALGLAEQEASDKKRELSSRLDKLVREQIQNRKDRITNQQESEINGIERLQKAEENRFKLATSAIDQQKTAFDLYSQSLDRTSKLEESRQSLSKALADAAISDLEIRRDGANRALDITRKTNAENPNPNSAELEILNERSAIEDQIALKKLESLKQEQEYQKKSLALDLQRQKIAAQMAVWDAESGQLSAAKSKLDAESALKIAQIKKDDSAIESAKVGLELAQREIILSEKRLNNKILDLNLQEDIAQNATQAQQVTQNSATAQQLAAESARQQATALEKVEASTKKIAQNSQNSKEQTSKPDTTSTGSTEGWKNPYDRLTLEEVKANKKAELAKKNIKYESDFDYAQRIATLKMTGQIQETRRTTNTLDESGFDRGSNAPVNPAVITPPVVNLPPSTQTYAAMPIQPQTGENLFEAYMRQQSAKPPQPEVQKAQSQKDEKLQKFTDSLNAEVAKIAGKLDDLISSISNIAARPSVLQVNSANAVSDAADIYSNISKNAVRSSGI